MIGERPKLFWQMIEMAFLIGVGRRREKRGAIAFSLVAALLRLPFGLQTTGSEYQEPARKEA